MGREMTVELQEKLRQARLVAAQKRQEKKYLNEKKNIKQPALDAEPEPETLPVMPTETLPVVEPIPVMPTDVEVDKPIPVKEVKKTKSKDKKPQQTIIIEKDENSSDDEDDIDTSRP